MDIFTKNLVVMALRYFLRWLFSNERNQPKKGKVVTTDEPESEDALGS